MSNMVREVQTLLFWFKGYGYDPGIESMVLKKRSDDRAAHQRRAARR